MKTVTTQTMNVSGNLFSFLHFDQRTFYAVTPLCFKTAIDEDGLNSILKNDSRFGTVSSFADKPSPDKYLRGYLYTNPERGRRHFDVVVTIRLSFCLSFCLPFL
ncbi:hypothetical protein MAR_033566 [Mya arenaria]|uniref:Uncharacterized protein n=1 Tax=Mya arenaria TaxID=6604 RepID=A0ABY7GC03_MYAAR|nr:hypothetical protein MAR_033566 [Mya arenaria]